MTSSFVGVSDGGIELCLRASLQVKCAPLNAPSGHGESREFREGMSLGKMRILPSLMWTSF